jgi:hypothetical protein
MAPSPLALVSEISLCYDFELTGFCPQPHYYHSVAAWLLPELYRIYPRAT